MSCLSVYETRVEPLGLELIKHFEGLRLKAYRDSGGVLTIGYGHTTNVYEKQTITEAEAETLFAKDIRFFTWGGTGVKTAKV